MPITTTEREAAREARELRMTFRECWPQRKNPAMRLWLRYAAKRLRELRP